MKKQPIEAKYTISLPWVAVYFVLLVITGVLFFTRSNPFWSELTVLNGLSVGSHISNFALSYFIITACGVLNLMSYGTTALVAVWMIGGMLILANVIYELFIPLINTRDIVDMWYGIAGTVIGGMIVLLIARFGLVPKKS